jgi:hypothetical protein
MANRRKGTGELQARDYTHFENGKMFPSRAEVGTNCRRVIRPVMTFGKWVNPFKKRDGLVNDRECSIVRDIRKFESK